MHATTIQPTTAWLGRVRALIQSGETGPRALAKFLPAKDEPDYGLCLERLVKADLRSCRAEPRSLAWAGYRQHFPELPESEPADDFDSTLASLAASHDLSQTPLPPSIVRTSATQVKPLESPGTEVASPPPRIGEEFAGFKLIEELGRGAFGRVFLAAEHKLAEREVALKIARKANRECQRLARLQHTNIVPIQNAFEVSGWHVLQMPFFGRQTLASMLDTVRGVQGFPHIGGEVFATTQMRATTDRKTNPSSTPVSTPGESKTYPAPTPVTAQERLAARETLAGLTYIDAAVWLIARIADGLAHAHSRGILHLDLKPHNVLISDDGQPMLLDFNLSYDTRNQERDRVGGTWPYMPPEQIAEYIRRPGVTVDARTDLYSLGVLFFELLTLRQPFPPVTATDTGLSAAIEARMAGAPDVRDFHPQVPPSLAAVVAKLLDPTPSRRYQSADQLREDLQRHTEHRPLAHVKDRSIRERAIKWHRRNPRASLIACITVLGFGFAFTAAQMMSWSRERDRSAAILRAGQFRKEQATLRLDLGSVPDAERRAKATAKARAWLDDYRVGEGDWSNAAAIRLLPEGDREAIRRLLAETALMAAHAEWLTGRNRAEAERTEYFVRAEASRTRAAAAYGDSQPKALDDLSRVLKNQPVEGAGTLTMDPDDLYASAMRLIAEGKYEEAANRLVKLTEQEPDHFAGQFALGIAYENLGQYTRACERFQIAKPLAPNDARPAMQRGLLLLTQCRFEEAESDFSEALRREPSTPGGHVNRALARKRRGNLKTALEDVNAEIHLLNGQKIIAYVIRAQIHEALGEARLAKADREIIDTLEPITDLDYVARAARWLKIDPKRAVADYDCALAMNPDCYAALMNRAHVYADEFKQPEMALKAMERAVKIYPGISRVRAGYAVLLARLGRRDEAHQEAEAALLLARDPEVTYQISNVFALTSSKEPGDRERALTLFRQCLRDGYRDFNIIDADPDMANLRGIAEYQIAVKAARELFK